MNQKSILISLEKKRSVTKVASVLVPEALMHILSAQNEDETDALGQDETSSGPATQRASNK